MHADFAARRLVALSGGFDQGSLVDTIGGLAGTLERRSASFEMAGGLGPDFYPVPAAATHVASTSMASRGHELLEQRAASFEMRGGLGPDFYPS